MLLTDHKSGVSDGRVPAQPAAPFRHGLLLYGGPQEYLDGILPFLSDGRESGAPMLVVVPGARMRLLRDALGPDSADIRFADMAEVGANPARLITLWQDFLSQPGGDGPVRGVAEPVWPGRGPAELVECQGHEALLNLAFAGAHSFDLLCPYDDALLETSVLQEAMEAHPYRFAGGRPVTSGCDAVDADPARAFRADLPDPPQTRDRLSFGGAELPRVRDFISDRLAAAGAAGTRAGECLVAVNEVATNSLRHGGGAGLLSAWTELDRLIFQVEDRGLIDNPLAGRTRPVPDGEHGYGLWLVNQICDLVQIRSGPAGTVVRLHIRTS